MVDRAEVGRVFLQDTGPTIGLVFHQHDTPGDLAFILSDSVAFAAALLILRALGVDPHALPDSWPADDDGPEGEAR